MQAQREADIVKRLTYLAPLVYTGAQLYGPEEGGEVGNEVCLGDGGGEATTAIVVFCLLFDLFCRGRKKGHTVRINCSNHSEVVCFVRRAGALFICPPPTCVRLGGPVAWWPLPVSGEPVNDVYGDRGALSSYTLPTCFHSWQGLFRTYSDCVPV